MHGGMQHIWCMLICSLTHCGHACLQDGVAETGVSLLYTVKAMDAGPIIAQKSMCIDDGIQADALLFHLFARGTK